MIPTATARQMVSGGATASAPFGISAQDTAHIMGILREGLYSDRILAVLREYSANAWDAHQETGQGDRPIEVHLPRDEDDACYVSIRDYGPGLSVEDVFTVFNQYGRSSKRGSNLAVGQLGIGSKSAFCYADAFTIISIHGGHRRVFVAAIDSSNLGRIDLLHEAPTTDSTGVEIRVAVQPADIKEFEHKAINLFQHFRVQPIINVPLPPRPGSDNKLEHGHLWAAGVNGRCWLAVMGCVPYRVNLAQIDETLIGPHLQHLGGLLFFAIGEVEISANREELKYTAATKLTLANKINALVDEFVAATMGLIADPTLSSWAKRLHSQVLHQLQLPIQPEWSAMTQARVLLNYDNAPFSIMREQRKTGSLAVSSETAFVIHDTDQDLNGYCFSNYEYAVVPDEGTTAQATQQALDELCVTHSIEGVPYKFTSTRKWTKPYEPAPKLRNVNIKHKQKIFELIHKSTYGPPYSDAWALSKGSMASTDVFVIIRNFKAANNYDFFDMVQIDHALTRLINYPMPRILGLKSTHQKPLATAAIDGVPYETWRANFTHHFLQSSQGSAMVEAAHYSSAMSMMQEYRQRFTDRDRADLIADLGAEHIISKVLRAALETRATLDAVGSVNISYAMKLANAAKVKYEDSPAGRLTQVIFDRYPLFERGLHVLARGNLRAAWLQYVHATDHYLNNPHLPHPTGTSL